MSAKANEWHFARFRPCEKLLEAAAVRFRFCEFCDRHMEDLFDFLFGWPASGCIRPRCQFPRAFRATRYEGWKRHPVRACLREGQSARHECRANCAGAEEDAARHPGPGKRERSLPLRGLAPATASPQHITARHKTATGRFRTLT